MLGNAKICTFETTGRNFHWIHPDVFDESALFKASAQVQNSAKVNPVYFITAGLSRIFFFKASVRHLSLLLTPTTTHLVATGKTVKQLGNGLV